MPNGGSDCCGTCRFNAKNKGEAGYSHNNDPEPASCIIRGRPIKAPFYTYCANHPHRSRDRDPIPIGPVFTGDSTGARTFWHPSPDSEDVRLHLLDLLAKMVEPPTTEYPIGIYRDEVVLWQLGEFREARAVEHLLRVSSFDPEAKETGFGRTRHKLVAVAESALEKIEGTAVS